MCEIVYNIKISVAAGQVFPPVGDFEDKINSGLAESGVEERMSVRANLIACKLEVKRELTRKEIEQMKEIILAQFAKSQPAWKAQIESFRRQSGNVQQSVA